MSSSAAAGRNAEDDAAAGSKTGEAAERENEGAALEAD